jgi:hypothetical protein
VAPHHRGQVAMLIAEGPVAVFPTPVIYRGHCTGKAAFGRYLPNHVLAVRSSGWASSMIRITGIGDHDRPDCLITMTGIRT